MSVVLNSSSTSPPVHFATLLRHCAAEMQILPPGVLRLSDADPLTKAIAPPLNETPSERDARLIAERDAKIRSDAIDEELNRQRVAERKSPNPVKVLLLGKFSLQVLYTL